MFRVWAIFYLYQCKNYNKLPLSFLSDAFYWIDTNHQMAKALADSLHIFNDYYVENFHSSLRRQIQKSSTPQQIIKQAKIIDQMRNSNTFTEVFSESHNIRYTAKQLEYLEKRTAIFLLNPFTGVCQNLGEAKAIPTNQHSKTRYYRLPTFNANIDAKFLPLAWSTVCPPKTDKYCDLEDCIETNKVGVILICGHAYHYECFLFKLTNQCKYCTNYLVSGIEKNCKVFQKSIDSFSGIVTEENENEWDIIETCDNTNNENEGFTLDNTVDNNTVDNLLEHSRDALKSITIQFENI